MKSKVLFWTPRVISILAILFMLMFSLDCFEGRYNLGEKLTCFLMHNIPSFLLIIILIVAWKWELAGGIIFILAAVAGSVIFRAFSGNPGVLYIMTPFLITGVLFILNAIGFRKKSEKPVKKHDPAES